MAEHAHTPAPWRMQEVLPGQPTAMWDRAPEGHAALRSTESDAPHIDVRGGGVDSALYGSGDGPRGLIGYVARIEWPPNDEARPVALANARLIAASPALLDSLLAVEWGGAAFTDDADVFDCCPNCFAALGSHHTPVCELRDALDAALGVKSPRVEVVS